MAIINNITETLHRIRAKLYPSYLPGAEGEFIARTDDESGQKAAFFVSHVKQFYHELIYQLLDGFSVNNGFYTIYLKIGGFWAGPGETFDPKKHPVSVTFRPYPAKRFVSGRVGI